MVHHVESNPSRENRYIVRDGGHLVKDVTIETVRLLRFSHPRALKLVRGRGQYVWDEANRRYLDFHCGNGAAFLGHSNPIVVSRVREQLEELSVCFPVYETPVLERCLRSLSRILPPHLSHVYFLNSGSESVELAMKLARKHTGRKKFVAFTGAFHGRTMGALSVTYNQRFKAGFDPFPWEQRILPFNDINELEKVGEDVAAVIVEPVQGEGGLNVASKEFLKEIERRCRDVGAYMIVDEVQTGFGRTGSLWAHSEASVRPDILVAGKAIGGGFPVGMVAVTDEIAEKVEEGEHGSTYGCNPLALAAVDAAIEVQLRDLVYEKAKSAGANLQDRLLEVAREFPMHVRSVKGKGLMTGLELRQNPTKVIMATQEFGLLTLRSGATVLRLLPPYMITREDIDFAAETISRALSGLDAAPRDSSGEV